MTKENKNSDDAPAKKKRRVSRPPAAVAILLGFAFLFVTAVELYAVTCVPEAPSNWNARMVKKVELENKAKEAKNENVNDFKFVVFADTHNSIRTFNRIMAEIDAGGYLFAMDNGDMSSDSSLPKFRLYFNQVSEMKTPVLTVVGNHDIEPDGYANYRQVFGAPYYSFTVGNSYFIVLDNANEKSLDTANPGQTEWFKSQLEKSRPYLNLFVFMHVPPFRGRRNPDFPMDYFMSDRKNARDIRTLLIRYNTEKEVARREYEDELDRRLEGVTDPGKIEQIEQQVAKRHRIGVTILFTGHCHTNDNDVWPNRVYFFISGSAGGNLWDVEKYRSFHHYFSVTITDDGKHGRFETEKVETSMRWSYQWIEKTWAYIFSYILPRYWLLALPLLAGCILFAFLAFRRGKKKQPAGETPWEPPEGPAEETSWESPGESP